MQSILVIHSNRIVRLGMRDLLTTALPQLQVFTTENAKDALTLAHRKRPLLILLADDMPGVPSAKIAQALRALPGTHAIPVVGVASPERENITAVLREFCDDCLPASPASGHLLATVESYLSSMCGVRGLSPAHC